jgi:hypothetical protein
MNLFSSFNEVPEIRRSVQRCARGEFVLSAVEANLALLLRIKSRVILSMLALQRHSFFFFFFPYFGIFSFLPLYFSTGKKKWSVKKK